METVHVFASLGRFGSWDELRAYVDPNYTEDGSRIDSPFMAEVELSYFEPGHVEAVHSKRPVPLAELIGGCSYSDLWLHKVDDTKLADAAICVYAPNVARRPLGSS